MKINKRKIEMTIVDQTKGDNIDFILTNEILTCRIYHRKELIDTIAVSIDKFCELGLNTHTMSDYDAWQLLKQHRLAAH